MIGTKILQNVEGGRYAALRGDTKENAKKEDNHSKTNKHRALISKSKGATNKESKK